MRKQPGMETAPARVVNLLSVSPADDDHNSLQQILAHPEWSYYTDARWILHRSTTIRLAVAMLRDFRIPVVVCEHDLNAGTWCDLLRLSSALPEPPHVIVSSRLADEYLWAEALNLGAYDVLAKPFDPLEVARIVSLAWLHWARSGTAPAKAITCVA